MSAERYYTKIEPYDLPSPEGEPRFRMKTQSLDEERPKTEEQLRKELTKEGRIYQPIKWASRIGYAVGIIYAIAGATGHTLPLFTPTEGPNYSQMSGGIFLWLFSEANLERFGNILSSWESKKRAFNNTFPDGQIHLIPEKFHPSNLFNRFHSRNS